jgi:hypothetical protein
MNRFLYLAAHGVAILFGIWGGFQVFDLLTK